MLGCALCVATSGAAECSEEHTCHFGTCAGKREAVRFVTHNFTSSRCNDPRARAVGSYAGTDSAVYSNTRNLCVNHEALPSACRRRRIKSEADTLLIALVTAVVAMRVHSWFF